MRPFCKADGVGVRPVICREALCKLAAGAIFRSCAREVGRPCDYTQYGSRRQDGAGQIIAQVQAGMAVAPEDIAVSTDARTAFGMVHRSCLWRSAIGWCPRMAGFLLVVFGNGPIQLWADEGEGCVASKQIGRGIGQSGRKSCHVIA